MKATKIFMMAALALTFAACSNNDDNDFAQQPIEQPANGEITITATVSSDDATTRALSPNGSNIASTWETTDQFAILYNDGTSNVKREATVSSINGSTVTITFTIPSSLANNTACTIVYPASAANAANTGADVATALAAQVGTIGNCPEVRVGTATIDKDNHNLAGVTKLAAQNAIFKLTLKDIDGNNDVSANSVIISDLTGVVTTVTPASGYDKVMYVALPTTATTLKFLVTGSDSKKYFNMASSLSLSASYYQSTVKLATVGDVILSTGKCAKAGTSGAVAKICYLGDETGEAAYNYTNGLALAMSDASTGCKWKTENSDAGHTKQTSSTFTEESGLQYNATHNSDTYPAFKAAITYSPAAPTGCSSWFLASGYQWQKMAGAVGGSNNLGLIAASYWSSTEYNADNVWSFFSLNGDWSYGYKTTDRQVRACLAF